MESEDIALADTRDGAVKANGKYDNVFDSSGTKCKSEMLHIIISTDYTVV